MLKTVQYYRHLELLKNGLGKCNASGNVRADEKTQSQQQNRRTYCELNFFSENVFQVPIKGDK